MSLDNKVRNSNMENLIYGEVIAQWMVYKLDERVSLLKICNLGGK